MFLFFFLIIKLAPMSKTVRTQDSHFLLTYRLPDSLSFTSLAVHDSVMLSDFACLHSAAGPFYRSEQNSWLLLWCAFHKTVSLRTSCVRRITKLLLIRRVLSLKTNTLSVGKRCKPPGGCVWYAEL